MSNIKSRRLRSGLYEVTRIDTGHVYFVDQIHTDAPGYGSEWLWWVTPCSESTPNPWIDPQCTKAEALQAISMLS